MDDSNKQHRSIRVWMDLDIEDVKKHLLLIDDLYGTCANCKHLGLNYLKNKTCPGCGAEFRYLATNLKNPAEIVKIIKRLKTEKLPMKLIDRNDFDRASARDALGDLFS